MKKEKSIDQKRAQINRLLDLINDAETSIQISREMGSTSMVKGHQLMKQELVDELLVLLKSEFKINVKLDKAA